jgi:alanine racemase
VTELSATRAIIDLDAYAHNLSEVRRLVGADCRLMPIVKADAYGHGLVPIARRAEKEGAFMLGVATVSEGIALREAGIRIPILVMVETPREAVAAALEHDLRLTISCVDSALHAGETARRLNTVARVHCKIDTGMGRQGFSLSNVVQDLVRVTHVPHVDTEAVWTHFASADRTGDTFTAHQLNVFKTLLHQFEAEGLPYELVHAANSSAIIAQRGCHFDMVRPGLMTYGIWPTDTHAATPNLRPVLRWETQILLLRDFSPNATIGYGRTYTVGKGMRGALLPVGYGDGYRYALSNRAEVLIRGQRCPVRGTVCMDQIVVDVTQVAGVSVGDVAVLIGQVGDESIRVEDMARWVETIPYEITTCITQRVPRVYVGDG